MSEHKIINFLKKTNAGDRFILAASFATPLLMLIHTIVARLGFTGAIFFIHLFILCATIVSSYLILSERARSKRLGRALQEGREKFEGLVNNLSVGVYRNTPGAEGKFLEVNPAIVAMFEANSKEEFLQHSVSDFYQDKSQSQVLSQKLEKRGLVKNEELALVTLRGRKFIG